MSHRIGFDPNLPLVAGTDFSAGEVAFKVGDVVDWKTAGITEQIAFDWWRSGMIYHPNGAQPIIEVPADVEASEDVDVAAVIADVMAPVATPVAADPDDHAKPKHRKKH